MSEPETTASTGEVVDSGENMVCGLIMPISATERFKADHWKSMNLLLHRCIAAAGFSPQNVWENSSTDRVSERIIGNIFSAQIVIADITDLNANVMLEVGLRLSSKKPTVVILAHDSVMPFDLRDFHAIYYPKDLNILEMEEFFRTLTKVLRAKSEAFSQDDYVPFLSSVIVDVVSPQQRELAPDQLVLKRLDDLATSVERLQSSVRPRVVSPGGFTRNVRISNEEGIVAVYVPKDRFDAFAENLNTMFEVDEVSESGSIGNEVRVRVRYSGCTDLDEFADTLNGVIRDHGGRVRVPPPRSVSTEVAAA